MRRRSCVLWSAFLLACGSSTQDPSVEVKAQAFAACRDDTSCEEGLFCAKGGPIAGHCTLPCETDSQCEVRYGVGHQCTDTVCVQRCGFLSICDDPPSKFVPCSGGLSCRGNKPESTTSFTWYSCESVCSVPSWGDEARGFGVSSGSGGGGVGGAFFPGVTAGVGGPGGSTSGGGGGPGGAVLPARTCGDGTLGTGEACDDGNEQWGDGCSLSCNVDSGFSCSGTPSVCVGSGLDRKIALGALSSDQALTLCTWFYPLMGLLSFTGERELDCWDSANSSQLLRSHSILPMSECAMRLAHGLPSKSPWYCLFSDCTSPAGGTCKCPPLPAAADAGSDEAGVALEKPFGSCTVGDLEGFFSVSGRRGCDYSYGMSCLYQ